MISTKTSLRPFVIMNVIGMKTMFNVLMLWESKLNDEGMLNSATYIKEYYMDKGKMGVSTGEGFYKYPNPAFEDPDFLKLNNSRKSTSKEIS
jgi:3-hydroxybutyryl-CoA dehydrogenase